MVEDDAYCCPEEEVDDPRHIVIGPVVRLQLCTSCRQTRHEDEEDENEEHNQNICRAKAVLEFFRGERDSPLTDAERRDDERVRRVEELTLPVREYIERHVQRDRESRQSRQEAVNEEELEHLASIIDIPNMPASFCEWSRINRWDIADATLDREVEEYLEYLQAFTEINYRDRWMTGALQILEGGYEALEFVPDDDTGRLMTFNAFIRTAIPPVRETFGHFGEGAERYARYLFTEGPRSLEVYWRFLNFCQRVGQNVRAYLNTLSPTGRISQLGDNALFETFREWSASHIRTSEHEISADVQLEMDVDDYEHSYLGQNADSRMLLAFRDQRHRLRCNRLENFNFHPHTTGMMGFREWFADNGGSESTWDQGLELYSRHIKELGLTALSERFAQARTIFAAEDRREFEGRARLNPLDRTDLMPNPTQHNGTELGAILLRHCNELRELGGQRMIPWQVLTFALLRMSRMLYRYNNATATGETLTLEEWDAITRELNGLRIVFCDAPIFAPQVSPELASGPHLDSIGEMRDAGGSERPHSGADNEQWVVLEPEWVEASDDDDSDHEPEDPFPGDGFQDTLVNQLARANDERRQRVAEQRQRARDNERPQIPGEVSDESDIDPTDLFTRARGMLLHLASWYEE